MCRFRAGIQRVHSDTGHLHLPAFGGTVVLVLSVTIPEWTYGILTSEGFIMWQFTKAWVGLWPHRFKGMWRARESQLGWCYRYAILRGGTQLPESNTAGRKQEEKMPWILCSLPPSVLQPFRLLPEVQSRVEQILQAISGQDPLELLWLK